MVLITKSGNETLPIGADGPDFKDLPGTDGKKYGLASFKDSKIVVLNFTCNHCPYAQAYEDRFNDLAREYQSQGVAFAAINPNDADNYPDDGFDQMVERAKQKGYVFPYLRDESQDVARSYGAVCTPHIFVLNDERKIVYEGRIDDNWQNPKAAKSQDLKNTLEALLNGRPIAQAQTPPMGCSIKWKA